MYFRELCSTLYLLASPGQPLCSPSTSMGQKKTSLTELYRPHGDGFTLLWINIRKGCGSCWGPPSPAAVLAGCSMSLQTSPTAPGHSAPQLGAMVKPWPDPSINYINTFSPAKGRMQTMCFLHWRIEKEAVSKSLIIFANKIGQRVWLPLLSKYYLPLREEDELC